jgi:hypothetical protein
MHCQATVTSFHDAKGEVLGRVDFARSEQYAWKSAHRFRRLQANYGMFLQKAVEARGAAW